MRTAVPRLGLFGLMLSSLAVCGFGPPRIGDDFAVPDFEVQPAQLRQIESARIPPLSARAALIVDFASGQVLYQLRPHLRLAPASTTKIMTALLTLEGGSLDTVVTVSPEAAAEVGTSMNLVAGEQLTVHDLLYGLLLPSGNDAALALAEHDAGSVGSFVKRMNDRAKQLGLADTHFVTPDGLDAPGHLMSATDLAHLARFALRSQHLFDDIVDTPHEGIPAAPGHPAFDLTNLNQLLTTYPGADGVKTGTTPAAGQVLVGSATRRGHRLLMVVMASGDRYVDARLLLDHGFTDHIWLRPDLFFPFGLPLLVRDTSDALLPAWQAPQAHAFLDPAALTAVFTVAGHGVLSVPLEPID